MGHKRPLVGPYRKKLSSMGGCQYIRDKNECPRCGTIGQGGPCVVCRRRDAARAAGREED